MTKVKMLLIALFCVTVAGVTAAQESFTNCAAAFLNGKMVVDEYTPNGKCTLSKAATGTLTVCTADLSPTNSFAVHCFKFMVAIRDQHTKTLCMYSKKPMESVDIQKIMAQCKTGDSIVLITLDDEYALPHNEIVVCI